jgi:hypothetical protein
MTETWQELAAHKRSAEDRLIERHRTAFLISEGPGPGSNDGTKQTPWGASYRFFPGMYVAAIARRSAWPETQIVFHVFLDFIPDRPAIVMWPIWFPESWHAEEPPYNDVLGVNIAEALQKRFRNNLAAQPGPVLYFIWETLVDFAHPPAPGDPPPELLSARAETEHIRKTVAHPS